MITVYNIRGTNGSGKSTLARRYVNPPREDGVEQGALDLLWYASPTKREPDRLRPVEGYGVATPQLTTIVVGPYKSACGGLDAVPDFDRTFRSIRKAVGILEGRPERENPSHQQAVIAEGILASTVWGSWGEFHREQEDLGIARVAFCYLDTPLEVCLERIRQRQEAAGKVRDIKTDLVADKVRAIAATRQRALDAGALVYDIPYEDAERVFQRILTNDPGAREENRGH